MYTLFCYMKKQLQLKFCKIGKNAHTLPNFFAGTVVSRDGQTAKWSQPINVPFSLPALRSCWSTVCKVRVHSKFAVSGNMVYACSIRVCPRSTYAYIWSPRPRLRHVGLLMKLSSFTHIYLCSFSDIKFACLQYSY